MYVFGIRIDNISRREIDERIDHALRSLQATTQMTTLNGEILLRARGDREYRDTLNRADLNIIDGVGVRIALWRRGRVMQHRYTGADLLHDLLVRAEHDGQQVYFALARDGLVTWEVLRGVLIKEYPNLICEGSLHEKDTVDYENIIKAKTRILICNFGAPEQELFLSRVKNARIETLRICVGVGGACDFLAGTLSRAPRWMRHIGLEWFYRLWQQPWRWRRIIRAVIIFPFFALTSKD